MNSHVPFNSYFISFSSFYEILSLIITLFPSSFAGLPSNLIPILSENSTNASSSGELALYDLVAISTLTSWQRAKNLIYSKTSSSLFFSASSNLGLSRCAEVFEGIVG